MGTGVIQTLTLNNAFYHKGCCDDFNGSHYERLVKKIERQRSDGSPYSTQTIPHKQNQTEIGKAMPLFATKRITRIS